MQLIRQSDRIFRGIFNALRKIGRRPVRVDASARRRQFIVDDPDGFVSVPYAKFHPKARTQSVVVFEEGADFHGEFLVNTGSLAVADFDDGFVSVPSSKLHHKP